MNLKKILFRSLFVALLVFFGYTTNAETLDINLTIRDGSTIVFSGNVPMQAPGDIDLNGHTLNANSVLSVINDADNLSADFKISDLQYYDSFSSFYLKCIESSVGNHCDNWQYTVNDSYPGIGMDKKILSGGESVYVYFGPQYKTILNSSEITTNDSLVVSAQEYDYQNDSWKIRIGATAGLTKPDPANPFSPIEIETKLLDEKGQAIFSSIPVGQYQIGIKEDYYFPVENLNVKEAPVIQRGGGGGGILATISNASSPAPTPVETIKKFDLNKAIQFLLGEQKENGSFGEDMYSDWAAIALSSNQENTDQKNKLIKYFSGINTTSYTLTDFERHGMALMSLGVNPHEGENYINKIIKSFDGKQFGEINEDNDDIFALIVLQNAGFTAEEKIISDDISFILSKQKENGSWDDSVDMTGASITALSFQNNNEKVKDALSKAKEFLKQNQKETGGWKNVSSTAWAMEGILSFSEKPEDWSKNNKNPLDYLAINQDEDGGIKNDYQQNKIWETSYVISALSGKSWTGLLNKFEKPKEVEVKSEEKKDETEKPIIKKIKPKIHLERNINLKAEAASVVPPTINSTGNTKVEKKSWFITIWNKIFGSF